MEGDEEDFLLSLNHDGKSLLFLPHVVNQFVVLGRALGALHVICLLLKLLNPHNIALDLVVDNLNGSVTDLIG
jgi:hypothetical protein